MPSPSPADAAAPDRSAEPWEGEVVAEVAGDPFTARETAAAISVGVLSLVGAGLLGILLSALADEHRLTVAGIGQTAMLEALSMGLSTGLAGILLKPRRLRLIGVAAGAALVLANLATLRASGGSVLLVRTLAGVPEGVLLWIAIGLISRTATPERWAGALFTGMGVTQLLAAATLSAYALPRFGANGGYATLAGASALCLVVALFTPPRYGPMPGTAAEASGAPPPRGWIALAATLAYSASLACVSVYLIPLAHEAGLSTAVGRTAVSVSLACQILGGALATALAGRVRHMTVFWLCAAVFLMSWATYAVHAPGWWFVAISGLGGLAGMLAGPFLVPMTIEADPSRRAAVQSGAVQVLAGALGPFLASLVVTDRSAHGVLVLGAVLLLAGLTVMAALSRAASARAPQPA
jgi:predicted MFS family arabinose efflux permease